MRLTSQQLTRYMTAIHEAGHAVAAHHLGVRIEYATIRLHTFDTGQSAGHVRPVEGQSLTTFQAICCLWAGICAEKICRPKRFTWNGHIIVNQNGDMRAIQELYAEKSIQPSCPIDFTRRHYAPEVTALLKRHWQDVLLVAAELIRCETLTGEDIRMMLDAEQQEAA
jgi:hypothetical protein